jgi:hypothetical protein
MSLTQSGTELEPFSVYSQTEKLRIFPNEPKCSSRNSTLRSGVESFFSKKRNFFVRKTWPPHASKKPFVMILQPSKPSGTETEKASAAARNKRTFWRLNPERIKKKKKKKTVVKMLSKKCQKVVKVIKKFDSTFAPPETNGQRPKEQK